MGAVKKPKPFVKARIELNDASSGAKKQWLDVAPHLVSKGDILVGEGLVVDIQRTHERSFLLSDDDQWAYRFTMKNGNLFRVSGNETVRAFTEGTNAWPQ